MGGLDEKSRGEEKTDPAGGGEAQGEGGSSEQSECWEGKDGGVCKMLDCYLERLVREHLSSPRAEG